VRVTIARLHAARQRAARAAALVERGAT
jgi:hypothetical protein